MAIHPRLLTVPAPSMAWLAKHHAPPPPLDPLNVLNRIAALHDRLADRPPKAPAAGSVLDEDDRATDPYHLSHAARFGIGIALDHLEAFRSMIQDAQRTQPWAPHTLLRAALENAATAVWLLGPEDPLERRWRRLKIALYDAREGARAAELHGMKPASGRTPEEVQGRIRALKPDDRSIDGRWSYEKVVRTAAEHLGQEPNTAELLWRVQSGLAHGRTWASLGALERETRPTTDDAVANVRLTSSVGQLLPPAAFALGYVRAAAKRLDALGTPPEGR